MVYSPHHSDAWAWGTQGGGKDMHTGVLLERLKKETT
jgi:hypothetical protein